MPFSRVLAVLLVLATVGAAKAQPLFIVNHSFEADPNNAQEFFFGDPTGWTLIDPAGLVATDDPGLSGTDVQGTLSVSGPASNPAYFGGAAPDGDNVAILFIGEQTGAGEVGIGQVLADTLAADTLYSLSVAVGNINSGPSLAFGDFDLSGFPGYRVELLAGGAVLTSTSAGIDAPIGEGLFELVTLDFFSGSNPAQLGQPLEIRLFNLNLPDPTQIPTDPTVAIDLEVDFDDVRLSAQAPEPGTLGLLALSLGGLVVSHRRRRL